MYGRPGRPHDYRTDSGASSFRDAPDVHGIARVVDSRRDADETRYLPSTRKPASISHMCEKSHGCRRANSGNGQKERSERFRFQIGGDFVRKGLNVFFQ
jgi:hypothetical protein